jgi:hypothetical protein
MRVCTLPRPAGRFLAVVLAALSFVPLQAGTADAKRIKIRSHSDGHSRAGTADRVKEEESRFNVRFRSGASPSAGGEREKEQQRVGSKAAAAAERARAALEAEAAQKTAGTPVTLAPAAVSQEKAKSYQSGAMCVAGC